MLILILFDLIYDTNRYTGQEFTAMVIYIPERRYYRRKPEYELRKKG
jgi:hypothetical protein